MSEMITSGGFSSASEYCRSWSKAAARSARRPLYTPRRRWCRFQTSAQPSPPVSFRAPRSKQYASLAGSASAGVASPSRRHRSRKCSCDAERSFSSDARHFAMKACGVAARSSGVEAGEIAGRGGGGCRNSTAGAWTWTAVYPSCRHESCYGDERGALLSRNHCGNSSRNRL